MVDFEMDGKTKERFKKRCGVTVRLNGIQHLALFDSSFKERRSMSSIIREATMEYLRIMHGSLIPPCLTNYKYED